jgi:hypothetical protein
MVVDKVSGSAIERYVVRIDRPQSGAPLTVFILRPDCTKAQRLEVLAEVRGLFWGIAISMVGDEIAAFAKDDRGMK